MFASLNFIKFPSHRFPLLILFLSIMTVAVAGCATPITHATPSGKVEATIKNKTKAKVKDKLTNEMINKGYTVTKSDDTVIAFDRPADNNFANAFLGSRYDGTPNARITFNLIQTGKNVRVIADCTAITNPGSAFERRTDMNGHPQTKSIQSWLDYVKIEIEHQ